MIEIKCLQARQTSTVAKLQLTAYYGVAKDIKNYFEEYISELEFTAKLKPKTLQGHRHTFRLLIKLKPDISLYSLTTGSIAHFFKLLNERHRLVGKGTIKTSVQKSTIATYWSRFNQFFSWLERKNLLNENPLRQLKRPIPRYENKKYLQKEEVEKIITAIIIHSDSKFIRSRNLTILYLLLFCGLRKGELLLLQIRDIDLDKKLLTIRAETSKVDRTRYIPLHSTVMNTLKDYLQVRCKKTTPFLIASQSKDKPLTIDGFKHIISSLCKASGVNFHAHQLRHTFAVNFLKSSNNIAKLQQLLGHSDPKMTLQYIRCLPPTEMRKDIEVMSLDAFL